MFAFYSRWIHPITVHDVTLAHGVELARRMGRQDNQDLIGLLFSEEERWRARFDGYMDYVPGEDRGPTTYRGIPFDVCECANLEFHRTIFQQLWRNRQRMEYFSDYFTKRRCTRENPFGLSQYERDRLNCRPAPSVYVPAEEKPKRPPSKLHPLVQLDEQLQQLGQQSQGEVGN